MPLNVADLTVTLRGDASNLKSALADGSRSATQFKTAVNGVSTETNAAAGAFGGLVREGMSAERGLLRLDVAMARVIEKGDLSLGSISGLARGFGQLAPTIFPLIGIITTVVLVFQRWKKVQEEQQAAADASAESARKWVTAHENVIGVAGRLAVALGGPGAVADQQQRLANDARTLATHYDTVAERLQRLAAQYDDNAAVWSDEHKAAVQAVLDAQKQADTLRALADVRDQIAKREREADAARRVQEQRSAIDALSDAYDRLFFTETEVAIGRIQRLVEEGKITQAYADERIALLRLTDAEQTRRRVVPQRPDMDRINQMLAGVAIPGIPTALPSPMKLDKWDEITRHMKTFHDGLIDVKAAALDMTRTAERALIGFAETFGNVFTKGHNVFLSFAAGLLEMGATVAKQLGMTLIKAGITAIGFGQLGIALRAFAANPLLAIGVGAALVALGSAMSSAEQSIAGNAGSGGGSSYGSTATYGASQAAQGDLTIVFDGPTVFDPSDPNQIDQFQRMIEAAQGRRITVQRRYGG